MLAIVVFSVSLSASRPGLPPSLERAFAGTPAIAVKRDAKLAATFWIAGVTPGSRAETANAPSRDERVAFPRIPQGALVAAVRFEEPWSDYRDFVVPPGVYTLRYVRQPAIKEHKGVSAFRDFLVIASTSLDREVASSPDRAVSRSEESFDRGHPAVLAISRLPPSESPQILENSRGEPALSIRFGEETLGLVLAGHGKIDPP